MKKPLRITLIVMGILAGLLLALLIAARVLIDPDLYKAELAEWVQTQTGRPFAIHGEAELSLFPWIGLKLGKLELGNPPGFGKTPLARLERLGVQVAVWPLLRGRVHVARVRLQGLWLHLERRRDGRANWQDLGAPAAAAPGAKAPETAPASKGGVELAGLGAFSLGGLSLREARVVWDDRRAGRRWEIRPLNLKTGALEADKPWDLNLDARIHPPGQARALPLTLDLRLVPRWAAGAVDIPRLKLELAGARLEARLKADRLSRTPRVSGQLEIAPFRPRAVLANLGLPPAPGGKKSLERARLKAALQATADRVELDKIEAELDRTRIRGQLSASGLRKTPRYRFTLALDELDLDRYTPPPESGSAGKGAAKHPAAPSAAAPLLPLGLLRDLDARGRLRVARLKAAGLHLSRLDLGLKAAAGHVTLEPLGMKLYGGHTRGRLRLDARGRQPRLNWTQSLKNVEIGALLKDLDAYDKFSGRGDLELDLAASGNTEGALKRNLSGNLRFKLKQGRVTGVNLIKTARRVGVWRDQLQGKKRKAEKLSGDDTVYERITGTVQIQKGIARNQDLVAYSLKVRLTGRGSADLATDRLIKYKLYAKLYDNPKKPPAAEGPIRCRGRLSDPSCEVQWEKWLRIAAQRRGQKEVEKYGERLKKKYGKDLGEQLQKGLEELLKQK